MRFAEDHLVLSGVLFGALLTQAPPPAVAPIVVLYGSSPLAVCEGHRWSAGSKRADFTTSTFVRVDMAGLHAESAVLSPKKQEVTDNWVFETSAGESFGGLWVSGGKAKSGRARKVLGPTSKLVTAELSRALGKLYPYRLTRADLVASMSGEVGPLAQGWQINLDGKGAIELVVVANSRPDLGIESHTTGDYSVALIRSGSKRTTLVRNRYTSQPKSPDDFGLSARIEAIADLDGNGNYEIVLVQSNFSGELVTLFSFTNGAFKSVAEWREGL